MKISNLSQSNNKKVNFCFKSNLTKSDFTYKKSLVEGLKNDFKIKTSVESLKAVLAPDELKYLLKTFSSINYTLGKIPNTKTPPEEVYENVINRIFRVNLHAHTNNSDGKMSTEEFLEQSVNYADKVAQKGNSASIPPYTTAITDHNKLDGVKKVIALIAQNPDKYKNLKFVAGCEFMLSDTEAKLEKPTYEVIGLGFNPFDNELNKILSKLNPTSIINKIKEFGGIASYAHPLRFCQGQTFDEKFVKYLKSIGINGVESNYQYNFRNTEKISEARNFVKEMAKKYDLYETGGTDTHGNNIFHDKAERIVNLLMIN